LDVKKVDRLSSTQVRLTIAFTQDSVKQHERSTAQRYLQAARIPGFRPGKAPLKMVMERYKDEIRKDVVSHLLEAGLWEAVEKTKLVPVSRPQIKLDGLTLDENKPFEFQVEFEVQPEIELRNYKGVPVTSAPTDATEDEVEKTIENLRDRIAVLEPSDLQQPAAGSFAVVEVGFEIAGDVVKTEAPKSFTVEVGSGRLLPEIDAALLEMKVGESRKVPAAFPDDYDDKNLAGKQAIFDCKLLEVKKKNLPEVNDALANQLKAGSTLETLRQDIRDSIRSTKRDENQKAQRQQIIDYLIRNNHFDVPSSLVQRQSRSLMESMLQDMKRRGKAFPELQPEQMKALEKSAEQMVRSSMLLREIAAKEKIAVSEEKLQERISHIAGQLQRSVPDTEKFLSGKGILDQIRDEVLTDQVFEFLLQNAELTEVLPKPA
jgi:trigger factor